MNAVNAAKARFAKARSDHPWLDRAVRTQEHYSATNGSQMAGAVTFFGFLSVFPILALAFFVVGFVAEVYPQAHDDLVRALDNVLPGLIGSGAGQIQLETFQDNAGTVGVLGLLGVLFAGLGWIDSVRTALATTFAIPSRDRPNLIVAKLRDLMTMCVLGSVMIASVGVTGVVRGLSGRILGWVGLGSGTDWLLWVIAVALGIAASSVLFYAMFLLLERPHLSARYLWQGALLGAIGFELLKNLAVFLLGAAKGQPAFQVFGMSLILLIWINYFSKVTLYAAAWAYAGERPEHPSEERAEPVVSARMVRVATPEDAASQAQSRGAVGAGAIAAVAGLVVWRAFTRKK